jgi:hypothetical protein
VSLPHLFCGIWIFLNLLIIRVLETRSGTGGTATYKILLLGCIVFRNGLALIGIPLVAVCCLSGCGGKSSSSGGSTGSDGSGPTAVSIAAAAASVDGLDSTILTATVANDNNADGVTWSLSGAGTLSNQTKTSVTYTAPAATSSAVTVTVMAVSIKETTKYATTTITVVPSPAITTTSGALAGAAVGSPYSVQLTGSSGITPYTWTVAPSSNLPAGLTLSAAGVLSGIPLAGAAGATNVTFQMKDAGTPTAVSVTRTLTIAISPASPITFTGAMPATASYNLAYAGSAAASGGAGALTYTVNSGALPTGLSLTAATGAVTGTATAAGTYNFSIKAADAFGDSATHSYQIAVSSPILTVTPGAGSLPFAVTAQAYSQTLTVSGGSGNYTWTVTGQSDGLNTSSSGATLTVSGTPTATGTVTLSVTMKDTTTGVTSGPYTYTITAYNAVTLPAPNPGTLGPATLSLPYSGTIVAAGGSGNYAWTVTGLPADNLTYSTIGGTLTISGTPGTATTVSVNVKLTDITTNTSVGPYTYTVTVYSSVTLPTPNPASLGPGDAGSNYSGTITVAGGSGNYSWTVTGLPADGLTGSATGGTLTISGTPASAATVSFNVSVKDTSSNTTVGPYTYTITAYGALALPAPNPSSLPAGYPSVAYTGTIGASGGSGNYSWQVTGLSDNLSPSPSGGTLTINGTPGATPATVSFNVKLTDTATNASITQSGYSIAIATPTPVTLPAPNPATLPSATTNELYAGSINASGGVPPYTWSVNGAPVPNTGAAVVIADGISVSSNGSSVLSVGGTPTAIQAVNLTNVQVTDSLGSTQTVSYILAVNRTSQVTGQISLSATCGATSSPVPAITLNLLTSPGGSVVQTVTSDSTGSFTFPGVHAGTYTVAPSITGPSSVFYPATQSVTLLNNDVNGVSFAVALGYTVSGTVGYSGTNTGQIYLALVPATSCGAGGVGTSVFTPGSFTIRGVPPGSYTLQAWMDLSALANGEPNTSDPSGTTPITVISSNLTGQSVTVTDNTPATVPGANPNINAITPTDQGVAISYKPVTSSGVEAATSYDIQWSTDPTFSTAAATYNFKAVGTGSNVWILNNGTTGVTGSPFTNGQTYYFEARARNAAGPASGWTVYGGGTPIGIAIGASTSGNQVQGTITIPAGITPTGPLYVGYYNQSTNTVFNTRIATPGSSNPYTVYVPTDTGNDYVFFEILDQNNDGLIDAGDVANTNSKSLTPIAISGPMTGQDLTLSTVNSTAVVSTQFYELTSLTGTTSGYNLNFDVEEGNKLPVAVTLMSGPNVINPVDIGNYCPGCGSVQFQYHVPLNGDTPTVGDTYSFKVTYSDSSSDTETITNSVTGWNGTANLVDVTDAPSNLSPHDQNGLNPNFSWSNPSQDSVDIFSFNLFDPSGNTVWQVPGPNSNVDGFPSSITSLNWGVDPTDSTNDLPPGFALTTLTQYSWQVQAQDSNGNQALTSVTFQASGVL